MELPTEILADKGSLPPRLDSTWVGDGVGVGMGWRGVGTDAKIAGEPQ